MHCVCSLDVPQFLLSTKFFACLELDDSRKVAEATTTITLTPHSILFRAGDDSSSGIFVVREGCLGMFLPDGDGMAETNKLMPGESVGDLDVIDGAGPATALEYRILDSPLASTLC
jgi:CRP-like cAMP-binding protein